MISRSAAAGETMASSKCLHDEVVQLPEREHMDVVIVHETLNGELAATVFVFKEGSELPLVVEAELLFSALCQQV